MNTPLLPFDGPRLVRPEEVVDSVRLFHLCFGGSPVETEEEIRAGYSIPRRGGTYAIFQDGKPVSQIGIFHDQIKLYDGIIRTGSIGGVCTHPDFRGQGLANRLMDHCSQQLVKEGATLMLISGARGLYTRLGNVYHGKFNTFSIKAGQAAPPIPTNLVVRKATRTDALLCSQLYQAKPVHFLRKRSDFLTALEDPNTYLIADPYIVERAGQALAYLFLGIPYRQPEGSGIRHVSEYAGSHLALAETLKFIIEAGLVRKISCPVAWQDFELIHLLQEMGYGEKVEPLDGHTLRIVDFHGFMKDLRPILEARLDAKLLRGLRYEQSGPLLGGTGEDRYAIVRGRERLELDGAALTYLVMGNADMRAEPVHAPGTLREVISALFPLPSFLPGLNYH